MRTLPLCGLGLMLCFIGAACILLVDPLPMANIPLGIFLSTFGLTLVLEGLAPRRPATRPREDWHRLFLGYPR